MDTLLNLPLNASAHGAALDRLTGWVHYLMLALFLGWGTFFVYVLFRFRASRSPRASYAGAKGRISKWSEIVVIAVEVVLLFAFSVPLWAHWVDIGRMRGEGGVMEVRVVAEQFAWNIHYPGPDGRFGRTDVRLVNAGSNPLGLDRSDTAAADDITTINQLHLAKDRPVIVRLSSKDVIHSFSLPYMRVKQDAIPGMEFPISFTPTMATPTENQFPACVAAKNCWEIACAQLCGLSHFRMKGYLVVHEAAEFDAWLAAQAPKPAVPAVQPPGPAPADTPPSETAGSGGVTEPADEG